MYRSRSDPGPSSGSPDPIDERNEGAQAFREPKRGFLAELTHAMQAAAERQREASAAEVEAMTRAHLERVRARAAAEAEELRRMAQGDIESVRAWRRAESKRIEEEAERRILERGAELDSYLIRHAGMIDGEVEHIEAAVADYQTRLDEYFDELTSDPSPVDIARLAGEMPEPPSLAKVGGAARVQAVAALAAESHEVATFSPTEPGPDLVPVMAPASREMSGSTDDSTSGSIGSSGAVDPNGAEGIDEDHASPAIRLLRSISTLAAPHGHPAEASEPAEVEARTEARTEA